MVGPDEMRATVAVTTFSGESCTVADEAALAGVARGTRRPQEHR
jgi:hypothetical protein